jgi:CHAD domain-containing protein
MPRPVPDCYLLDPAQAEALAASTVGRLLPTVTETGAETGFAALDDFDQSLRRSGRLLLESDGTVTLLQADGSVLSQPGACRGLPATSLPEGPVKSALADLSPLRSLLALGSGRMRRATAAFQDDEGKSQARAHLLTLEAETGMAVAIATLQGLRGYARALADLSSRTLACGGVPLEMDVLYLRLFPDLAAYDARPDVALRADQSAFEAAGDIIAAYIPVARANEGGIIADHDSEFLHDYRVALRKIRSVLSLFRGVYDPGQTADLKARFSRLMAATGRLRDLDVALLDRRTYHDLLPASLHAGLDAKFALLAAERKTAKTRLVKHLRHDRYAQEISALADLFSDRTALRPGPNADLPARAFACSLIWKRYRRIRRIAKVLGPDTDDAEVHGLRIECKKLRYLMEFFAPLFPKDEFRSLLRPLKALQDNLGLVNDAAVQQANLQLFVQGTGKRGRKVSLDVAQSVGALTAVLHRRQIEERTRTGASLAEFTSPQTARVFRDLFHAPKDRP